MFKFNFETFAQEALGGVGDVLVEKAHENMDKVSIGRVYVVGGKPHIASKVGDSPNNLSGALRGSIRYEIKGKILEFGAGDNKIDYAKYLELGTKKMGKRPNYTKSIIENKKQIDKVIKEAIIKNIRFSA